MGKKRLELLLSCESNKREKSDFEQRRSCLKSPHSTEPYWPLRTSGTMPVCCASRTPTTWRRHVVNVRKGGTLTHYRAARAPLSIRAASNNLQADCPLPPSCSGVHPGSTVRYAGCLIVGFWGDVGHPPEGKKQNSSLDPGGPRLETAKGW